MKKLFINSGVFTGLDAATHWCNHTLFTEDIISIIHFQVIPILPPKSAKVLYRVIVLANVTDEYYLLYRMKSTDEATYQIMSTSKLDT